MSTERMEREEEEFRKFNEAAGSIPARLYKEEKTGTFGSNFQDELTEWADATFGRDIKTQVLHLWEELEEAIAEAWRYGRVGEENTACEEIADAGLIVMHIASTVGVRLPDPSPKFAAEMRIKFERCKSRTWAKRSTDGVMHHIEPGAQK